ncbi:Stp1/IreP family PP2C-type Ser/Thr phosphatase [Noviherbaspirillum sp.]|uniref:Stp1/IreP family PP2C-type Ser/Thr phosphatase n=1 Tax=Noviherbaspirillum sp. TaxID=1926288 RepID=UPI002D45D475|nr:Stp1/IreP family PP2C-type Ser/Thr phosphatase [Noviherbaspirillum sp.]HZW21320.1 Stp1/IreP family PP2C-type Ser/Thr phosphatase [Noviherbaspirillum sp.]
MGNRIGLELAGLTDPGLMRAQNEDAIALGTPDRFIILADGMGGYNAGEVASSIATKVVYGALDQSPDLAQTVPPGSTAVRALLVRAFQQANSAILEAARAEPAYHGMGTTLVAAVFHGDEVTVAHVGDSRAYRLREGELRQITRDHSLLQEQIDAGLITPELARFSSSKNLVTRAVGVAGDLDVEVHGHRVQAGDIYLLCSDGLTDMLSDTEVLEVMLREGSLDDMCRSLVQRANSNGGLDNISVVLAKVTATGTETPRLLDRIRNWVG